MSTESFLQKLATLKFIRSHTYKNRALNFTELSIILILLIACKSTPEIKTISDQDRVKQPLDSVQSPPSQPSYNFSNPDYTYILDQSLKEISGLTYDMEKKLFITHNDENGIYFYLNPTDFSIVEKIEFSRNGDYESIEKVNDDVIISKNNGTLFFHNQKSKETATYDTPLSIKNNVEGLCYLQDQNLLLLACKGQPYLDKKRSRNTKCIYAFDLKEKSMTDSPFITLRQQDFKEYVTTIHKDYSKSKRKKLLKRINEFAPSGIAIHPDNSDFYILSARGSTLVILDKNKILKRIVYLDKNTIPQPEGIIFDHKGNLYIATEGQGYNGKIFQYMQTL